MDDDIRNEQARLEALKSFQILDTSREETFDRLAALAARICETPMAIITLIDEERQWFKATVGLDVRETERAISFCTYTIHAKDLLLVPDATTDPRFLGNPLVTNQPGIRAYAGVPLITSDGFAIGSLAVLDTTPRQMKDAQLAALHLLADHVMKEFELRLRRLNVEQLLEERTAHADAYKRQTRHLNNAQHVAGVGSWELGLENNVLYWSEETYRIFGVERDLFKPDFDALMSLIHPEDRAKMMTAQQQVLQGVRHLDIEHRVIRPGGEIRHVQERAELIDVDGQLVLSGTVRDITVERKTQEHLRLLEACIACMDDVVMITEAEPLDEPGPRVVFVNDAFERRTGYRRDEIIGRSPRLLQGPKTARAEIRTMRKALEAKLPVDVEIINYTKDGREFWLENNIVPVTDESGYARHFVGIQRDVTERKMRMLELANTNRSLQMLSRCAQALIKAEKEEELLVQICKLAVDIGGYRMAWVGYAQDDVQCSIVPMAYAGPDEDGKSYLNELQLSWAENNPTGQGPGGRTIRTGRPVILEDISREPSFALWMSSAQRRGYQGVISLPLRSKGRTFGFFAMYSREVRPVADKEISLLQELADNLAYGIGALRAEAERQRTQTAMLKVAAGVSASTDTSFFQQLAANMADALGANGTFVARILPGEPLTVRIVAGVVDGEPAAGFDYPLAGTPCETLARQRHWIVPDRLDERYPESGKLGEPLGSLKARAYAGKRLDDSTGRTIGLVYALYRQPLRDTGLVLSTLQIFAARAAGELERLDTDMRIRNQASLLDKAQDAIMVCDTAHRVLFWNKGAERLYGWTQAETVGQQINVLLGEDESTYFMAVGKTLVQGEWTGEIEQQSKDGRLLIVESHWTLVRDENGTPQSILKINTDITHRKASEREIQHLAFYDSLTRLPNRLLLIDRLQHAIATVARNRHTGALLFIDLDNFKTLNDTLGHDFGDMLLKQVAQRLKACVRDSNTVARLGGDEFVVLLEDLSPHTKHSVAQAKTVAENILAAFSHPFQLDSHEHNTTPSIGITLFSGNSSTIDELLKRADLAMYQAKAAGRNTLRFFDPQMQTIVSARAALEADFRHGLLHDEFVLHYQTQSDANGHTIGVEALVRWQHKRRGMVSPAAFIPLAEETGLIVRLGQWVIETACAQLATWARQEKTAGLDVSVNVSARQFRHPDFVDQVMDALERTGANPQKLKLELTESLLLENVEETIVKMTALKKKGVGFSLDDFGTGYSSLAYLKRLPLDQLKIDQSFVRDVLTDPNDAAIARTIVALGRSLGLSVMAEGVETIAQRDFLAHHGCHAYQGFLFSQPMPAERL
ncbi:MAG TPA: EAL domain-containing protein [Noviherbaspirillum sp.]|jgi:diguanylate cyclase (GGDEF)-like protein/PAS domain S-box-containing protein|uniref:EAL domain-containing protein n=1 Tax=Noviherbaspirillum sp. TaxID=1926288 RepID=UPI002DDCFAA7|nr:EAL domain-containing protein [Noviherbaspirillum sp.]HEV2609970.1 EAL domain-containing protein [Noviherbaspirillum sp.]